MAPSQAELLVDPTHFYRQILGEYELLWEMVKKPYEFDEEDFETEYFYRREIYMTRKDGVPYFKHFVTTKKLTEQMQVMLQRHNVIATFANTASDLFLMGNLSYEEYCALARACFHDIVLNINGEEYSADARQMLYEQDYRATEFYGVFSKAVDAALAGDYRFAMDNSENCSRVQVQALEIIGKEAMANFCDLREDFINRKNSGLIDENNFYLTFNGAEQELVIDRDICAKNAVTKEMSTFEGQFTLDEAFAVAV